MKIVRERERERERESKESLIRMDVLKVMAHIMRIMRGNYLFQVGNLERVNYGSETFHISRFWMKSGGLSVCGLRD